MTASKSQTRQNRDRITPLVSHLDAFLLAQEAAHNTPATLRHYRYTVGSFIRFLNHEAVTALQTITPYHIRAFLVSLERRGRKDTTLHAHARGIKAWLNWLVREGVLASTPMRQVKMPKLEKRILPALSREDLQKLLAARPKTPVGLRDRAIILCLLDSGLRAGEFCRLRLDDVDLRTGILKVHGKGRKDRVTRFGAKARLALVRYLATRSRADSNSALSEFYEPLWIAYTWDGQATGRALTTSGLRMLFRRLAARTGVQISAHQFRRTFALWCLRQGMDVYSLQMLMGHSDLHILRRYLDLAQADIEEAHRRYSPVDHLL